MENFLYGIEAILKLMQIELSLLFQSAVMRGFLAGFIVSTLIFGFLETSRRHRERVCETEAVNSNKKNA